MQTMADVVRVMIADDSALIREGVSRLLAEAGLDVVGAVDNATDLLTRVAARPPDVVVVDIRMPPGGTDDGLRAARAIRDRHPGVGVLVLSQHLRPAYAVELLADGVAGVGYLLKDRVGDVDEFVDAVRRVGRGGTALDPHVVASLMARRRRTGVDRLTGRERDVLALMAEGRSNAAIARALRISEGTVEKHAATMFGKLGLSSNPDDNRRVLAVLAFLRRPSG